MKKKETLRYLLSLLLLSLILIIPGRVSAITIGELLGWDTPEEGYSDELDEPTSENFYESLEVDEDGVYDSSDEVCAYLVQYHHLPDNYMTKREARKKGWEGGALSQTVSGKCIGGDVFGNSEQILPEVDGRVYHECDIDTLGRKKRGIRRIIYSGDDDEGIWNIYYTEDHYETFTLLYGSDDFEGSHSEW